MVAEGFDEVTVPLLAAALRVQRSKPPILAPRKEIIWRGPGRDAIDERRSLAPRIEPVRVDADGEVEGQVTDAVFLLNHNFLGGPEPACLAACDVNGDGDVLGSVTDAVYLLTFNFLGGPPPVGPFPDCGAGSLGTDVVLGCETTPKNCP